MNIDVQPNEMRAPEGLRAAWQEFKAQNPKTRIRDAANALNVSEAELVATGVGDSAVRLEPAWSDIMNALPQLGRVMALTRNESCVHERKGRYEDVQVNGKMGIVLGPDIDLRLFLSRWSHVFAVSENGRRSVQIFDDAGQAVHKVYAIDDTDMAAFDALVARFRAADQSQSIRVKPAPTPAVPTPFDTRRSDRSPDRWGEATSRRRSSALRPRTVNARRVESCGESASQAISSSQGLPVSVSSRSSAIGFIALFDSLRRGQ